MQVASLSWHLETVSASDPQGQTFYFRCDEWVEREQVVLFPSFDPMHVGYTVRLPTLMHGAIAAFFMLFPMNSMLVQRCGNTQMMQSSKCYALVSAMQSRGLGGF